LSSIAAIIRDGSRAQKKSPPNAACSATLVVGDSIFPEKLRPPSVGSMSQMGSKTDIRHVIRNILLFLIADIDRISLRIC
jgi:hypothetical protein